MIIPRTPALPLNTIHIVYLIIHCVQSEIRSNPLFKFITDILHTWSLTLRVDSLFVRSFVRVRSCSFVFVSVRSFVPSFVFVRSVQNVKNSTTNSYTSFYLHVHFLISIRLIDSFIRFRSPNEFRHFIKYVSNNAAH